MKLYQYAILFEPTEKQIKEEGAKPKIVQDIRSHIAKDEQSVLMFAASQIPAEYREQMDQIKIPVVPF